MKFDHSFAVRLIAARTICLSVICFSSLCGAVCGVPPRNIVLFIGDGMGPEQIKLARMYANGDTAPFGFETLPWHATMTHNNIFGETTDSAASATAMATGVKVANEVVSMQIPGDGGPMETILERLAAEGKATGLVTHSALVTDATPAAFGAHVADRHDTAGIVHDYLTDTRPNVLFGQASSAMSDHLATSAGYQIAHSEAEMSALRFNDGEDHALGTWPSEDEPAFVDMTAKALDLLDDMPEGFFLMVHEQDPDNGGHAHSRTLVANGVLSLASAFDATWNWAQSHPDTLLLVTADHETGGLTVVENLGVGNLPAVTWGASGHTQTAVDVYAFGPGARLVQGEMENTDIFRVASVPEPDAGALLSLSLLVVVALIPAKGVWPMRRSVRRGRFVLAS